MSKNKEEKLQELNQKIIKYQDKLAFKMKGYRGVVHESASSELRHSEVTVLQAIVHSLKNEIEELEKI